jgi:hypothetical protein
MNLGPSASEHAHGWRRGDGLLCFSESVMPSDGSVSCRGKTCGTSMSRYYALRLDLEFKHSLSFCDNDIQRIVDVLRVLKANIKRGMHTEKTICLIFVSDEPAEQLMDRLKPILAELHSVNNCWCGDCPTSFVGMNGRFDPAAVAIQDALRTADFFNASEDVDESEARKR